MGKEETSMGTFGLSDLSGSLYIYSSGSNHIDEIEQTIIPILVQHFPELKVTKHQVLMGYDYLLSGFSGKSNKVFKSIYNVLLSLGWEEAYAPWVTGTNHNFDKWLANNKGKIIHDPLFRRGDKEFKELLVAML